MKVRWDILMGLQKNIKCWWWSEEAASETQSFQITHSVHVCALFLSPLRASHWASYIRLAFQAAACLGLNPSLCLLHECVRLPLAHQQGRLLTRHAKFWAGILQAGARNPPAVCSAPPECGRVLFDIITDTSREIMFPDGWKVSADYYAAASHEYFGMMRCCSTTCF